jgi:dienelactone hydrolase
VSRGPDKTGLSLMSDDGHVAEHRFELTVGGEQVPGLLWVPSGHHEPGPAVLIGHGRGGHKRDRYSLGLALRLVRQRGWAVVALDAPAHGERRDPGADPDETPPRPGLRQVAQEWRACVDFIRSQPVIDPGALGYWGVSMGASMGIAFLAADPRVRCAVLGLMHRRYDQVRVDAPRVSCPVLFLLQWDDTRVPRGEGFELFDAIGSRDKRLHAQPGGHSDLPGEEITAAEEFFARYLSGEAGLPAARS